MAIDFRIADHSHCPGVKIVEILVDGKVVGAMYPVEKRSEIKVVSAHLSGLHTEEGFAGEMTYEDGSDSFPSVPAVTIKFHPSPWTIVGGRIVRE